MSETRKQINRSSEYGDKLKSRKFSEQISPTEVIRDAISDKSADQIKKEKKSKTEKSIESTGKIATLYTLNCDIILSKSIININDNLIQRNSELVTDGLKQAFVKTAFEFTEDGDKRGVVFVDAMQMELLCKLLGICEDNRVLDYVEGKSSTSRYEGQKRSKNKGQNNKPVQQSK